MLIYRYAGSTIAGVPIQGVVIGFGEQSVRRRLTAQGILCDSISPFASELDTWITTQRSRKPITGFARQLSDLLAGGLLFHDAWKLAASQTKSSSTRSSLEQIQQKIEHGESVGDALESEPGYFDSLSVQMVKAGELSGQLDVALKRIADFREQKDDIQSKIRSALWYPIIVITLAVAVIALLFIYIVPVFEGLYASLGATLPPHTQFLLNVSKWLQDYWHWAIVGAVVTVIIIITLLSVRSIHTTLEEFALQLPAVGEFRRKIFAARFTRTLGNMLEAGVSLKDAYPMAVLATDSVVVTKKLLAVQVALESGTSLGKIVQESDIFPMSVAQFITSGENTGQLGAMLNSVADILERDVKSTLTQFTKLIEPIVIIILGVIVMSILVTIYLPMFELVSV